MGQPNKGVAAKRALRLGFAITCWRGGRLAIVCANQKTCVKYIPNVLVQLYMRRASIPSTIHNFKLPLYTLNIETLKFFVKFLSSAADALKHTCAHLLRCRNPVLLAFARTPCVGKSKHVLSLLECSGLC